MKKYIILAILALLSACSPKINLPKATLPFISTSQETPQPTFSNRSPTRIALLLPVSGKLDTTSQAFQDGFFNAFYHDKKNHHAKTSIIVIDTHDDKDIVNAYHKAIAKGADFIIGPLTKAGVQTLAAQKSLDVPVLALNKIPGSHHNDTPLFFYSLAPEDEATQVALQAQRQGYVRALVIAEKTDWGKRTAAAFASKWQQAGGRVADTVYYARNARFDDFMNDTLAIQRIIDPQNPHKESFAHRNDIDMVFLAGRTQEIRQIHPFISLYYSDRFPVYSTASIYSATQQSNGLDRDLHGIVFCDMPWIIDARSTTSSLRSKLDNVWRNTSADLSRLYAMGTDAYGLSQQMSKTTPVAPFSYRGVTGYLSLNTDHTISRELLCAKIQDHSLKIMR